MNSGNEGMSLSAAARRADVNVETIRYYQRRGLIPRPRPLQRGIRRYSKDLVDQVRFIKRAQQLGFSLNDIAALLALSRGKSCSQTCALAERKVEEVQRKIADLQSIQAALKGLVTRCRVNGAEDPCPLVQALAGTTASSFTAAERE